MWMKLLFTPAVALAVSMPLPAAAAARRHRVLPAGHHWGRCLLVEQGETRISGPCIYELERDGGFHIDGPRQVFGGIDYPRPEITAEEQSNDYWANVFREDGGWTGYGNPDIRSVHGDMQFGSLRREGACFANAHARICLWRGR